MTRAERAGLRLEDVARPSRAKADRGRRLDAMVRKALGMVLQRRRRQPKDQTAPSLFLRPARVVGLGQALPQESPSPALTHQKQVCGRAAINHEPVLRSQHLSIVDSLGAFGSR